MDTAWIIVVSVIAIVAAAGTIGALVAERAPRVPVDPERLARLRERAVARDRVSAEERLAQERDARTLAPQRRLRADRVSAERLWAGGL